MPYREQAKLEENQKYGRLPGKKPERVAPKGPEHRCSLPIPPEPLTFFQKIFKKKQEVFPYEIGDYFRCSCGKVYQYLPYEERLNYAFLSQRLQDGECGHACYLYCDWWLRASLENWKDAGGVE